MFFKLGEKRQWCPSLDYFNSHASRILNHDPFAGCICYTFSCGHHICFFIYLLDSIVICARLWDSGCPVQCFLNHSLFITGVACGLRDARPHLSSPFSLYSPWIRFALFLFCILFSYNCYSLYVLVSIGYVISVTVRLNVYILMYVLTTYHVLFMLLNVQD